MQIPLATLLGVLAFVHAAASPSPADPPEVFSPLGFEAAKAAATANDRWLIVKGTAVWWAPCKRMDRTTWVDEAVTDWVAENGIAIQLDVDRDSKTARALKISSMPTVIAFRNGEEFDRVVGYLGPQEFLDWFEGLERGDRSIDRVEAAARDADVGGAREVRARYDLAGKLVQRGRHEEATDEYVWLWENIPGQAPAMVGVRGSFMVSAMERLAASYAPARARFAELRDGLAEGEDDWIALNTIVGESERTFDWFDRVKDDPEASRRLERSGFRLQRLLEESGRWSDLALLHPQPILSIGKSNRLRESVQSAAKRRDSLTDLADVHNQMFRDECGRIVASLLAASRDDEARRAVEEALRLDASEEMRTGLVRWAQRAGQDRGEVQRLVDGVGGDDDDLNDRVSVLESRMVDLLERLSTVERHLAEVVDRLPEAPAPETDDGD